MSDEPAGLTGFQMFENWVFGSSQKGDDAHDAELLADPSSASGWDAAQDAGAPDTSTSRVDILENALPFTTGEAAEIRNRVVASIAVTTSEEHDITDRVVFTAMSLSVRGATVVEQAEAATVHLARIMAWRAEHKGTVNKRLPSLVSVPPPCPNGCFFYYYYSHQFCATT